MAAYERDRQEKASVAGFGGRAGNSKGATPGSSKSGAAGGKVASAAGSGSAGGKKSGSAKAGASSKRESLVSSGFRIWCLGFRV